MNERHLLQTLAGSIAGPDGADGRQELDQADVLVLAPPTREQLAQRARRFVSLLGELDDCAHDSRGTWQEREDRTLVHLPDGARAIVYHASGALRYQSGLAPAEQPFEGAPEREALARLVEDRARKLSLSEWAGASGELRFERLFRRLGVGADQAGFQSGVTLFRAIGAWRQYVGKLPVLGAASATVQLSGNGQLDGLSVRMRPSSGEVLERAALVEPAFGARQIVQQLGTLLGRKDIPEGAVQSATMQLGYLDLGKRKSQRVLAPSYVAQVVLRHQKVRQAYVLAVRATERAYLDLPAYGAEVVAPSGRTDVGRCEPALR